MIEVRSASAMKARRENEIRNMMVGVFTHHREVKEAFEKRMSEGLLLNAFALRPLLSAQADMLPWGRVQQLIRTGTGIYHAMMEVRGSSVNALLAYGEAQSSDLLAVEIDRAERNGMRRYLKATARFTPQPPVEVPVLKPDELVKPKESDE